MEAAPGRKIIIVNNRGRSSSMASESSTGPRVAARLKLREPFSGLSHLGGAALGIAALVALVCLARGKPWHVSGFAIYGAALILLYLASALYHLLPVSE